MKDRIKNWMMENCMGYRNSKPRHEICAALGIDDRSFRRHATELKKEGHIASDSEAGYWSIPLVIGPDQIAERDAVKHAISDKFSRGYTLIEEGKAMAKHFYAKVGGQHEFGEMAGI
jgi:hypothetical protein